MKPTIAVALLSLSVFAVGSPAVIAQGTARSLDLDPSVRAAGMGGASIAVFWGDDGNHWANPALLGYQRGLRYEWGKTRLVPGLAADVSFETELMKMGGGGLGFVASGPPFAGVGGLRVDYGESEITDSSGNPIGTITSFEDIEVWGFGVSLAQLFEGVSRLCGRAVPDWSRHGDVSLGLNSKHIQMALGPGISGEATARDIGLLVRVTPLDWTRDEDRIPLRLDVAFGSSVLNQNDPTIRFDSNQPPTPTSRHERNGVGLRAGLGLPTAVREGLESRSLGWLAPGLEPMIAVAYAYDNADVSAGGASPSYETTGQGFEVTLGNIVSLRRGSYEDKTGYIDDTTWGWSLGFRLGEFGGIRYDRAEFPQAANSGLEDLDREAFSAWLDPFALWSVARPK